MVGLHTMSVDPSSVSIDCSALTNQDLSNSTNGTRKQIFHHLLASMLLHRFCRIRHLLGLAEADRDLKLSGRIFRMPAVLGDSGFNFTPRTSPGSRIKANTGSVHGDQKIVVAKSMA